MMKNTLTITRPDDFHVHLRDGDVLASTVPDVTRWFARAIVMPNLSPPILDIASAISYRERILAQVPDGVRFDPLMTLYLTENTPTSAISDIAQNPYVFACKLYFTGTTTQSEFGVTDIRKLYPVFSAMEIAGVPLLIHGEVDESGVDIFDREKVFLTRYLSPLMENFPGLRIVLEHITTREAVAFIQEAPATLAATITVHHLLLDRNHLLAGGLRPHYYCLPIVKRYADRHALVAAATSGNPKFFLGTDSAPHRVTDKISACGCAGIYSAPVAMPLYATVFEQAGSLDRLENFASVYGAHFYGLPRNTDRITMYKKEVRVPEYQALGAGKVVPFYAGSQLAWSLS